MPSDIILIGPIGAGKSTLGELLAGRLGLPQVSLDLYRWDYYNEIGYDPELARYHHESGGMWALYQYWKPFEAYAVERLLSEHHGVIDFGAGHSVYEEEAMFQRVQALLAPYENIVLLLPSPDQAESIQLLNERNSGMPEQVAAINEHFIRHHSNYDLAKLVLYTKGKTPEESCEEILGRLSPDATRS